MLNNFFIEDHVKQALQEDIGFGDITTDYLTNESDTMKCELNSRVEGVLCGKNAPIKAFSGFPLRSFQTPRRLLRRHGR